jgi:hypothetical protein
MAMALDPSLILKAQGIDVDPWQRDFLLSSEQYVLLNCTRQAGKSTVTAALGLHKTQFTPNSTVVILSPGQRQSSELFRKILSGYNAIGRPVKPVYETQLKIEFQNGSRILCLPGKEATVRSFSPNLLLIDEASRVEDNLYRAVRPMLAVSKGRLVGLSTPFGQRGWFWSEWEDAKSPFKKVKITWKDCPRITPEFIEDEIRAMGTAWVQQEYDCLFTAMEGLVYPDFEKAYTDFYNPIGKPCGGIDWGWRNPFAAVWGVLDREDVLWIQEERYFKQTPLHEHSKALSRIMWYADPAGATEMSEFRAAGHTVRKGYNDIRLGIAAVAARVRTGRLRVNPTRCPNLCSEAKLYRYPSEAERVVLGEKPVDEHNHALGALRYLISRLDARFIAKLRKVAGSEERIETESQQAIEEMKKERAREAAQSVFNTPIDPYRNEDHWTTF